MLPFMDFATSVGWSSYELFVVLYCDADLVWVYC